MSGIATKRPRKPTAAENAEELQRAYAARRREWAAAVRRPYAPDADPRPPPGELDASADE